MKSYIRFLIGLMGAALLGTAYVRAQENDGRGWFEGLLDRLRGVPGEASKPGDADGLGVQSGDLSDWLRDLGIEPGDLSTPEGWQELFRKFQEGGGGIPWEDFFGPGAFPEGAGEPAPLTDEDAELLNKQYQDLIGAHVPALRDAAQSTVKVLRGDGQVALGVVVHEGGWILTKSSELGNDDASLRCEFSDGETSPAHTIRTFDEADLALIRVDRSGLRPAVWYEGPAPRLGSFLAAPGPDGHAVKIGVMSVAARSLENTRGYLGVEMEAIDEGVRIRMVEPGTPAHQAGIEQGDVVVAVGGEPCHSMMQLAMAVGNRRPGEELDVKVLREGEERDVRVKLAERPSELNGRDRRLEMMNRMGGPLSRNREGFRNAIQTDLPLLPEECGGPLVDLDGNIVGINIARAGRIMSYALPAAEVSALLSKVDFETGTSVQAEAEEPAASDEGGVDALQAEVQRAASAVESAREALRQAEENARAAEEALRRARGGEE